MKRVRTPFLFAFTFALMFAACELPVGSIGGAGEDPSRTLADGDPPVITVLLNEDFETTDLTTRGWTGDLNNEERWDTSPGSSTLEHYSGSYAARYDCYNSGSLGHMISPVLDFSETENHKLSFYLKERKKNFWWTSSNYHNHLYVYISNDGGESWVNLDHIMIVDDWTLFEYDLDLYIAPSDNMKIRFTGQGGNVDDNWYDTFVDDVTVTGEEVSGPVIPTRAELLRYWAPRVYQDTRNDTSWTYRFYSEGDFFSKVNFDGDWNALNNWENYRSYPLEAYAYSSFQETDSHYFLGYYYFHAIDDSEVVFDRHENDMEGVFIAIRKNGSFGIFEAMQTICHSDILQYSNIYPADGTISFEDSHPKIYISSNGTGYDHGHGIQAYGGGENTGDDAIVYNCGTAAEVPAATSPLYANQYSYALVSIDELWSRRFNTGDDPFYTYGNFGGDTNGRGANAPWMWHEGTPFHNPALHFQQNFSGIGQGFYSLNYLVNPYPAD